MVESGIQVTIVIELFNREIISAILLKLELEKRGYIVSIKRKSEDVCFSETDILIIPNGYRSSGYYDYRYRFNCKSGKMINLQWEQLFYRYQEENNLWLAEGKAKELVFLCWGQNRVDKLLAVGVDKRNIFKVGPIQTDTMRNEFSYVWKRREEIANTFNLDDKKEWIIFISSLTYAPSDSPFIRSSKELEDNLNFDQRHIIEENTQKEIINWFEKLLDERNDLVVIYRPHPTEKESRNLMEAAKRHPHGFNVISDLDLKQWITVVDTLVLWNSTSAIECSMTKKRCIIARPYDIERNDEYILYDGCDCSRNYQDFKNVLQSKDCSFPINGEMLKYYYDIKDKTSFMRICDVIDKVASENEYYNFERRYTRKRIKYLIKKNILVKLLIKKIYCYLHKKFGFGIKSPKVRDRFFVDMWEKSIMERNEVINIEKRIRQKWESMIGR